MTEGVLIDSSAWIDFFNLKEGRIAEEVGRLIQEDQAVITEPVFVEVAIGTGSEKKLQEWKAVFSELRKASVEKETWSRAAENGYKLRRKGLTVPIVDLLLATMAMEEGLSVLHSGDKHFPEMARILGVSEYRLD